MSDTDPNAPWLTLAHIICTDAGIEQGNIYDRLIKLQDIIQPAKKDDIPYSEIIEFLNISAGKKFKSTSAVRMKIRARYNEGFDLEDFKHVIKNKCDQWLKDKNMCIYLRPETLFSNKFDSYLNETPKVKAALEEWQ